MLRKLLKYDLQSIFKFLIIFYSLTITFAVLKRIFFGIENSLMMSIIAEIFNGAAISMMVSTLINNFMRLWVRFRQNIYGDESYLTHTLPVTKTQIYLSKILTATITMFVSILVIGIALFISFYSKETITFIKNILLPIADAYDSSILAILIAFLFIIFLEFTNILQCGFTGMILGNKSDSAKIGFSVLLGFIAFSVSQLFVLLVTFIVAIFNSDFMNLFITNDIVSIASIKNVIYMAMGSYSFVLIALTFINIKLLKKGVNVD